MKKLFLLFSLLLIGCHHASGVQQPQPIPCILAQATGYTLVVPMKSTGIGNVYIAPYVGFQHKDGSICVDDDYPKGYVLNTVYSNGAIAWDTVITTTHTDRSQFAAVWCPSTALTNCTVNVGVWVNNGQGGSSYPVGFPMVLPATVTRTTCPASVTTTCTSAAPNQ